MRVSAVLAALLLLAACSSAEPERVDSSNPTVTYRYFGDLYGSQFDEVSYRAANYCSEQFGKQARLQGVDDSSGDENYAVFECV